MKKYFSIISIILAVILILLKLQFDIELYGASGGEEIGDMSPQINGDGSNLFLNYLGFLLISIILSIIGRRLGNQYAKTGIFINILALFYLIIPYLMLVL